MFGSEILDVAIGLIFVYLVVSVLCSAIREGIESWLKTRAAYLEHGIRQLLQDMKGTGLAKDLFEHPLIYGLFTNSGYTPGTSQQKPSMMQRGRGLPSYIPSKNFAVALLDIAARGPVRGNVTTADSTAPISLENVRRNVGRIQSPAIRRVILTALDRAQGDLDKAQKSIQDWYDSGMDRISGWYKRSTHQIILAIGLIVAVTMNIDSIAIVDQLYKSDASRAAAIAAAGSAESIQTYGQAKTALEDLHLPLGWDKASLSLERPKDWFKGFIYPWLGWLLTAIAASLGAPFWFDVLNKVMVIRSTVKPREKSPEEGSEDRQPQAAAVTPVQATPSVASPSGGGGVAGSDMDAHDAISNAIDLTTDEQLPATEGGVA
jgi:hypothetical protein